METDPTPSPIKVKVDQRLYQGITSVIVEEGVLTLCDSDGWTTSMAPGSWSRAERQDDEGSQDHPFGGDPRNLG